MMKDKGYKVKISEDAFCVRIPPRSAELVRLECE